MYRCIPVFIQFLYDAFTSYVSGTYALRHFKKSSCKYYCLKESQSYGTTLGLLTQSSVRYTLSVKRVLVVRVVLYWSVSNASTAFVTL
jgi:hypothetical protein